MGYVLGWAGGLGLGLCWGGLGLGLCWSGQVWVCVGVGRWARPGSVLGWAGGLGLQVLGTTMPSPAPWPGLACRC